MPELMAHYHQEMHMTEWEDKLGDFSRFNGREVLQNFGSVKREAEETLALGEYEKNDMHRRCAEIMDVDELRNL